MGHQEHPDESDRERAKRFGGSACVTRRAFLQSASLGAGVHLAAATSSSPARRPPVASPSQAFSVGFQIFGWGRYFPSAWWKGAAAVGAVGYRGIEGEYTIAELYTGRDDEFAAGMVRAGVTLSALYSTTDLERAPEQWENTRKNLAAAAFCARHGARTIVLGGTEAHDKSPAAIAAFCKAATTLGRAMHDAHGVRLAVHPHMGALIESRDDIARVMDGTDPAVFFLAPDTGHLLAAGCDPVEVCRTYAERIVHLHLKDYRPGAGGQRGAFLPLGEGGVDFAGLIDVLRRRGFSGWMNIEMDGGRGADPADVARRALAFVEQRLQLVVRKEAA